HAVERVVDLDRRQPCRVERQHLVRLHLLRIERALPLLEGITARAGQDLRGHRPAAAFTRARVSGRSRTRTPIASATAFASAAAVGPCAASPVPRKGEPGRVMMCTSTLCGTFEKRMIGYVLQSRLVIRRSSKVTAS